MTIGIFCPTDGEASTTIRTLREFFDRLKLFLGGATDTILMN